MEKYLLVENKGAIDIKALVLMGGSTKTGDISKIGLYGSGCKYAIALLLRKGIEFRIFSGTEELIVSTKIITFRDKEFKQILINGIETSLTTQMGGEDWGAWSAVREVVSNSIDEGEHSIINCILDVNSRAGYTRIYIQHHVDIVAVVNNWNDYFSFDRIDAVADVENQGKIFPQLDSENERLLLYRKGIQCYDQVKQRSLYRYDLPDYIINESRVISDSWDAKRRTCRFLSAYATEKVAIRILGHGSEDRYWENNMDWYQYGSPTLCNNWKTAIGDRIIINNDSSGFYLEEMSNNKYYRVPRELAKAIKKSFPEITVLGVGEDDSDTLNWRVVKPTAKIEYLLKKALEFLKDTEFAVNYPVQVVEFDKPEVLGSIDKKNKTLLVAIKAFDNGLKDIVMTLVEEHTHLQEGLCDETRAFEQYLIKQWISEKEMRYSIFL